MSSLGADGAEGARALRGALDGATRKSREWQRDQIARTGYATAQAEIGHLVVATLRGRGYPLTVASVGGQLAAVGSRYNWQGNARIAGIIGRSERTVQRARALLEADQLISSHLLLTGDLLEGQRSPVRHPQVVRDVSRLQRLASMRASMRVVGQGAPRRRRSAAEVPEPETQTPLEPMTAADWRARGEARPDIAALCEQMATALDAARKAPPPPNAATITPAEIEQVERETVELERELRDRQQAAQRAPPTTQRGPPGRAQN